MSLPEIPYNILEYEIGKSLTNVCETMIGERCVLLDSNDLSGVQIATPGLGTTLYVGSVGFVGDKNGVVYLFFGSSLIERIAMKVTGRSAGEIDSEIVFDACGELANVFGGGFKNSLAKLGYHSILTIPTVLGGDELYISSSGVKQYIRTRFSLFNDEIVADLALAEIV